MSLKTSYTLLAPVYDWIAGTAFAAARSASLAALPRDERLDVLLSGVGTGLDLPLLPAVHRYTALDLTPAMLGKAFSRRGSLDIAFAQGDSQRLSFRDGAFNCAILHLILAVVPDGAMALRETARVVRRGGKLLILDKFLKPHSGAVLRKMINPLVRRIATRTDVVFEELLAQVSDLEIVHDQPALANGWFRRIELIKR